METKISITLPDDFNTLCTIYQIKPEVIIQTFVNQVSFPCYYSHPTGGDRWATLFFLHFLDESECETNEDLEDYHLESFTETLLQISYDFPKDDLKSEEAGRRVMSQWLKAVLVERAKYLTDNL